MSLLNVTLRKNKLTPPPSALPSSFRDPDGHVFLRDDILYRQINHCHRVHYDHLMTSGLYEALTERGWLIPHTEVSLPRHGLVEAYRILKPERVPYISYAYEWCFSQLKQAALTVLAIQRLALAYDMTLKDACTTNVQFRQGRAVWIDTPSLKKYVPGEPWVAYRQFCEHFLAPLALMSQKDIRLSQLLRCYLQGIPLSLACSLLPMRTKLNWSWLLHLHLHARMQSQFSDPHLLEGVRSRQMSKKALLGLVMSLETAVRQLTWQSPRKGWVAYSSTHRYPRVSYEEKAQFVQDCLKSNYPSRVWDLGSNTGFFSRLAASMAQYVVSFDNDPACVEENYRQVLANRETNLLPLLMDIANPSAARGWDYVERFSLVERGEVDLVMALALVHHLAISNNVPFTKIAQFLSKIGRTTIVEFIPKEDLMVQAMLAHRKHSFDYYHQENFESAFRRCFEVLRTEKIQGSERILYFMQRRNGVSCNEG